MSRARTSWTWAGRALLVLFALVVSLVAFRPGSSESARTVLDDPTVWLASVGAGEVVQINATTGDLAARVRVGPPGQDFSVAQLGNHALVRGADGAVRRLDAATHQFDVAPLADGVDVVAGEPAGGALLGGGQLTLVPVDPAEPATALPVDPAAVEVVVGADGDAWLRNDDSTVSVTAGEQIRPVDAAVSALISAGGEVYGIDDDGVGGLSTSGHVRCEGLGDAQVLAGGEPAPGESVIVGGSADGTRLVWVDLGGGECVDAPIAEEGSRFGAPVVADDAAFVPDMTAGTVVVVDLEDRAVVRRFVVSAPGVQIELAERDGAVWMNEPYGNAAAIVSRDAIVHIDKQTGAVGDPLETTTGGGGVGVGAVFDEDDRGTTGVLSDELIGRGALPGSGGADGGSAAGVRPPTRTPRPGATEIAALPADEPPPEPPTIVESEVLEPPTEAVIANFTFSADVVRVNEIVSFESTSTGPVESWSWTFGDDTGASGPRVATSWAIEGTYRVTLVVDGAGQTDTTFHDVRVLPADAPVPPRADFEFSSDTIAVGDEVEFVSTSTGNPTTLTWQFGDGTSASGAVVRKAWTQAGSYTVTLVAANKNGAGTTSTRITVIPRYLPPEARISVQASVVDVGETLVLTDASSNDPLTSEWSFGDGTVASGDTVSHAWSRPGDFTVTLTVTNPAGSSSTQLVVSVREPVDPPVARIASTSTSVPIGVSKSFTSTSTGTIDELRWDFGDGVTATGPSASHRWASTGTFVVTLTAINGAGSSRATLTVTVTPPPPPPVADFVVAPGTVTTETVVTFTDTSTGNPTRWAWDFGDGSTSIAENPTHVFDRTGTFVVRLTASNSGGASTVTASVVVQPPAPVASFTFQPTSPLTGQAVTFTDTSTNGPTSWEWDFGDGTTSTVRNPSHVYTTPGAKTVRLRATNVTGTTTTTQVVGVSLAPPVASFTFAPASPSILDPVVFTNTSTGADLSYRWDFGDGTSATTANASHTYEDAGVYTVVLTVTNGGGDSRAQRTVSVSLPPPPKVNFTWSPAVVVAGQPVQFTNATTGAVKSYRWEFGDGTVSTAANPSKIYANPGAYQVRLTATGPGANNPPVSVVKTIIVLTLPPSASFTISNATPNVGEAVTFTDTSTGSVTSRTWLVDGAPSGTGPTLVTSFPTNGSHTVALTVVGPGGSATATTNLTVRLVPAFAVSNPNPAAGAPVTFTDTSQGTVTSWSWDFGDGSSSNVQNPTHTYAGSGPFTVTLTANGPGGPRSVSQVVNVRLVAAFTPSATTTTVGVPVVFVDASKGTVATRSWNFADGTTSTVQNPSHTWTVAGSYTVVLTLTGPGGPATASVVITVNPAPPPPGP